MIGAGALKVKAPFGPPRELAAAEPSELTLSVPLLMKVPPV